MKIDERRKSMLRLLRHNESEFTKICDIAEELNVSTRTVNRDLAALSDMIPISRWRGNGGGVVLHSSSSRNIVYVVSAQDQNNVDYCRLVFDCGLIPFCFDLFLQSVLDFTDYFDRESIMICKLSYLNIAKEIWVFGKLELNEINFLVDYAAKISIPMRYFDENMKERGC